jgi:hypothetical protein
MLSAHSGNVERSVMLYAATGLADGRAQQRIAEIVRDRGREVEDERIGQE